MSYGEELQVPGVVALTSLRADLGLEAHLDGLGLADLRHPEAVEQLLGRCSAEPVMVLSTLRDLDTVRTMVTLAATRFPSLHAYVAVVPGPSLALAEIGRRAAAQPDLVGAVAAFDALVETAWIAAWMPHVRSLSAVSPSLGQHLRSFLPGGGFLVEHAPRPHVTTLSRPRPHGRSRQSEGRRVGHDTPRVDTAGHTLVHSVSSVPWLVDDVRRALGPGPVEAGTPLHDVVDAHGSTRVVEFVTLRPDLDAEVAARRAAARVCTACGVEHPRAVCPWCAMTTETSLLTPDQGVTR